MAFTRRIVFTRDLKREVEREVEREVTDLKREVEREVGGRVRQPLLLSLPWLLGLFDTVVSGRTAP